MYPPPQTVLMISGFCGSVSIFRRRRLMRVSIPEGAREVVVAYRATRPLDVLALALTLLGLASVVLLTGQGVRVTALRAAIASRVGALRDRAPDRTLAAVDRWWPTVVCVLPLLGLGLVLARNARGTHLAHHLDQAVIRRNPLIGDDEVCQERVPEDGFRCASTPQYTFQRTQMCIDGRYHSCISAGPTAGRPLSFTWSDLPITGTLELAGGVADATQARGTGGFIQLRARVDGRELIELDVPNGIAWVEGHAAIPEGAHELEIEVVPSSPSQREFCFDAILR
jgi:hypothetical protein